MTTIDPDAGQHAAELLDALHGYRAHTYRRNRQYRRRRAFIEDVEWLLTSGESTWQVAHRLGGTRAAIARRLARYGRHDLARPFERTVETQEAAA